MRIGLIGCGSIAMAGHLPALAQIAGVEVAALADPDPGRLAEAARLMPRARTHVGAEALLSAGDLDAAIVAAPPKAHAELAIAALRSGIAVYVEKPLALRPEDAQAVLRARDAAGLPAAAGFNLRFHPQVEQGRALIAGAGALRAVDAHIAVPRKAHSGWRADPAQGGTALDDLASHYLDLIPVLCGRGFEPGSLRLIHSGDATGDDALIAGRMDSGASRSQHDWQNRVTLTFDDCRIELDFLRRARAQRRLNAYHEPRRRRWVQALGDARALARVRPMPDPSIGLALRAFVSAVQAGQPTQPPLEAGLQVCALVDALRRTGAA